MVRQPGSISVFRVKDPRRYPPEQYNENPLTDQDRADVARAEEAVVNALLIKCRRAIEQESVDTLQWQVVSVQTGDLERAPLRYWVQKGQRHVSGGVFMHR